MCIHRYLLLRVLRGIDEEELAGLFVHCPRFSCKPKPLRNLPDAFFRDDNRDYPVERIRAPHLRELSSERVLLFACARPGGKRASRDLARTKNPYAPGYDRESETDECTNLSWHFKTFYLLSREISLPGAGEGYPRTRNA